MKNDEKYSIFSQRMKERRNELGYTQASFAKKTEENGKKKGMRLNKPRIGKYETLKDGDTGFPVLSTAIFLAEELDCSLDWLCGIHNTDTKKSDHADAESVESILIGLIAAILKGEITDLSIMDMVEDKPAILLKHGLFEEFIDEYREAIELEESVMDKFADNNLLVIKIAEAKQEILQKYVQKYEESKKEHCSDNDS